MLRKMKIRRNENHITTMALHLLIIKSLLKDLLLFFLLINSK